ncbi:MAG: hypothetical protein PHY43_11415 [Verrucomicrobiales bacterium]|nr:hypothetical protein [Verrucomicrobiales bacterium]
MSFFSKMVRPEEGSASESASENTTGQNLNINPNAQSPPTNIAGSLIGKGMWNFGRYMNCAWHLGGSQTDMANLAAENIDWSDRVISYARRKTGTPAFIHFGPVVEAILRSLPTHGLLLPKIALWMEKHRAKEFKRRCAGLGITGVSFIFTVMRGRNAPSCAVIRAVVEVMRPEQMTTIS